KVYRELVVVGTVWLVDCWTSRSRSELALCMVRSVGDFAVTRPSGNTTACTPCAMGVLCGAAENLFLPDLNRL
ncbi:hypothetical protein ABTN17_20840, partial [Acinetobacter baumannii]